MNLDQQEPPRVVFHLRMSDEQREAHNRLLREAMREGRVSYCDEVGTERAPNRMEVPKL